MPRHLLTTVAVKAITKPGRYADGGGLYLVADQYGKRWLYFFQWAGKRREMGLGRFPDVSVAKAREKAAAAREAVSDGIDPIAARSAPAVAVPAAETFAPFAKKLIADLAPGWRGANTESGWTRSLISHAADLGDKPLDQITTDDVLGVCRRIWTDKPESATKMRARIEIVLDAAKAMGLREGENPARWRGHLDRLLPRPKKLIRGHHPSIPYADAPAVMKELARHQGFGARALEWTIYSVAREGMTLGARWSEIKTDWHVPGSRMKGGKDFVVPITPRMTVVLASCDQTTGLVFPGTKADRMLSDATMDKVLKTMGVPAVPHGFRATFRDWAGDCTDHAREVAEGSLAHLEGDETERAYRRGNALEKRRALMEDWGRFLWPD